MLKSTVAAFRGVSLIRLPFDIMQASALLTIVALAEVGVIRLPVMTPDGRITAVPLTGGSKDAAVEASAGKQVFGFTTDAAETSDDTPASA